jgi:hypothetical protein
MKDELIYKLNKFLTNRKIEEEHEVVYLFTEIRKILEHLNVAKDSNKYPILKFYCDWTLHISKDKITPEIKTIMDKVDASVPLDVKTNRFAILRKGANGDNLAFVYMSELRKELSIFLFDHDLPIDNVSDDESWYRLISVLEAVLSNQPIVNPNKNIKSFSFLPANTYVGAVIWVIEFNDQRGLCKFGNVY